jgi:hypothetical protein
VGGPQTPFTEYDAEFMYVCFDDRCPFLVHGWDTMSRQETTAELSLQLRSRPRRLPLARYRAWRALRESIVEE